MTDKPASRPNDAFDAMRTLVAEHLPELATEIIEWQDTAVLRRGKAREADAVVREYAGSNSLAYVEREVARQAMQRVSREFNAERAQTSPADKYAGVMALVDALREEEGSSVTIYADNADFNGQPNCLIEHTSSWTGWTPRAFRGDTLQLCLRNALDASRQPRAADDGGVAEPSARLQICAQCGDAGYPCDTCGFRFPKGAPAVFVNDGNAEDRFVEDGRNLNCPACGGSGHVDDCVAQPVELDVSLTSKDTLCIDAASGTKRQFSVGVEKDGSVWFAAYIGGDRYHGKLGKHDFGEAIRYAVDEEIKERIQPVELVREASPAMCDSVRYLLVGIEQPGRTFGSVRKHCEWSGMDTSHWPEWTKGRDSEHFGKDACAALIWHCMAQGERT